MPMKLIHSFIHYPDNATSLQVSAQHFLGLGESCSFLGSDAFAPPSAGCGPPVFTWTWHVGGELFARVLTAPYINVQGPFP